VSAVSPPAAPAHRSPAAPESATSRGAKPLLVIAVLALCEIAGVSAVVKSYDIGLTVLTAQSEFVWFWIGMLLIEMPVVALIAHSSTSGATRSAALVLFGIVTFLPKLLRNPTGPDFHDEYAHWRATYDILSSGKLFEPVPVIPILQDYPGLHIATAWVVHFTGLGIWPSGTILLVIVHLAGLLGIVALARSVGLNSRASAIAGILYGANASFLYFDTEFAYESVAIAFLIWSLVCFVQSVKAPRGERAAWVGCTVALCAGTVVTHHLSSLGLTLIMVLFSLALSIPPLARRDGWRQTARLAWGLTATMAAMFAAWIILAAPTTISYLSPYLGEGLSQLMQATGGSGSRTLFTASLSPAWEQYTTYLLVPVMLGLAVAGFISLRGRIRERRSSTGRRIRLLPSGTTRALFLALTVLGFIYFPSTLLIFSASGAEGARRSWADSWIGLTVSVAPVAVWTLTWVSERATLLTRAFGRTALALGMVLIIVGGTAAGLDTVYRFPGPYLFGSDARSNTPELDAMTQWFLKRFGSGNNIVTDRQTGLVAASSGLQNTAFPSAGFPTWDLYADSPGKPLGPPFLLAELKSSDYLYLIVDERMATNIPNVGVYFEPDETANYILPDGKSFFAGRLGKFNTVQWMYKVFSSDNYAVYRMALPAQNVTYQSVPVNFHGSLSVG
jgi:hypothetical protein